MKIDVTQELRFVIDLGYVGENNARTIDFDLSTWVTKYGTGTVKLYFKKPNAQYATSKSLTLTDGIATWTITSSDLDTVGSGDIQIVYTTSSATVKSNIWYVATREALTLSVSTICGDNLICGDSTIING